MPGHAADWSSLCAPLRGRRVCVTGGAGFIGSHLVDALLIGGAQVRVIDDLSGSDGAYLASLVQEHPKRLHFIFGSILEPMAVEQAIDGCDVVFHLAAFASVPRSIAEPERCMDVNVTGTVRVLEEARRTNVRRVVFAGSSSAYGEGGSEPRQESMTPSPVSPYGASKLAGEYALRAWSKSYALDAVTLRYFNIFGPRQSAESAYAAVIAAFIRRYSENQPPVIHGDGSQSRDFTYIDNAVLANILAATSERPFEGQAINVGAGRSTTVLELAEEIGRMMGATHLAPVFEPARPGDVRFSLASLERARSLLGYEPVCPLTEGLRRTIEATVGTNPRAQARELKA